MDLSISSLDAAGAFTGAPVKKEVTWKNIEGDDITATVYVQRLNYRSAVSDIQSFKEKKDALAGRIAACIVDKKGKPIFTPDDITGDAEPDRGPLDGNLTVALMQAIGEVNNMGKAKGSAT